jgi:hypothetical protein
MLAALVRRPVVALLVVLAAVLAVGSLSARTTSATFNDATAAQMVVTSSRWATSVCVIQSREDRPENSYTIASNGALRSKGWTNVLDKRTATSTADLAGCDVVMIAAESWSISTTARDLAQAWANAGGSVLSTGNDSGAADMPSFIASQSEPLRGAYPYGGSVPASAAVRSSLSPAFPTWTPGAPGTWTYDTDARAITAVAPGATCVATVTGHPEWCAAIARTTSKGGRWVHMHTKIGAPTDLGDVPGADAALAWLAIGRG